MLSQIISVGGVVNKHIVKSTATAVIAHHMPAMVNYIPITDSWAKSILGRMNLVKRKGKR